GLHCRFLTHQRTGRGSWLSVFGFGLAHLVAGLTRHDFRTVVAQTLHFEVRRLQVVVRQDEDARAGTQFDLGDRVALFVEQEGGNLEGYAGAHFGGTVLECLFLDQAQNRQRQRLDVADDTLAVTTRADDTAGFTERRTQALAGHFKQAEARDATDL